MRGVTLACKAVPSRALDDTVITNALLQFITFALTRSLEVEAPIKEAKGGTGGGDDKPQKRILKMWAKVRKHVQSIVMSAHQVSMQIGGGGGGRPMQSPRSASRSTRTPCGGRG